MFSENHIIVGHPINPHTSTKPAQNIDECLPFANDDELKEI